MDEFGVKGIRVLGFGRFLCECLSEEERGFEGVDICCFSLDLAYVHVLCVYELVLVE